MGIPVLPSINDTVRSMVRIPGTGWSPPLPSKVLDLSRSSALAAAVYLGRVPLLYGNSEGAVAQSEQQTVEAKLGETKPSQKVSKDIPSQHVPINTRNQHVQQNATNWQVLQNGPNHQMLQNTSSRRILQTIPNQQVTSRDAKLHVSGVLRKANAGLPANVKAAITVKKRPLVGGEIPSLARQNEKRNGMMNLHTDLVNGETKRQRREPNAVPALQPQFKRILRVTQVHPQGSNTPLSLQPGQMVLVTSSVQDHSSSRGMDGVGIHSYPGLMDAFEAHPGQRRRNEVRTYGNQLPVDAIGPNPHQRSETGSIEIAQQMALPVNVSHIAYSPHSTNISRAIPPTSFIEATTRNNNQIICPQNKGSLLKLKQEAEELRAINFQLKKRLTNYQNLFRDKKKLEAVINTISNRTQVQ